MNYVQNFNKKKLILLAPLSGRLMPIEQVPDQVFAKKMVGDGIAIDPISQILIAPCDGEIVQLHPSHHAVTLKTPEGLEILMHIGLDTVALRGQSFTAKVKMGEQVKTGDHLIEFDADYVACHAKSLLTAIVITNLEKVASFSFCQGNVTVDRDPILEIILADGESEENWENSQPINSENIIIPNRFGLHARPSAVLVNLAKKYKSQIRLQKYNLQANAKSVLSLINLQVIQGDTVNLIAQGEDAQDAINNLSKAIRSGLGEAGTEPIPAPASIAQLDNAAPAPRNRSQDKSVFLGVAVASGIAVGKIYQLRQPEIQVKESAKDTYQQHRYLENAIEKAKLEIEALRAKIHSQGDPQKATIFAAYQELIEDPELLEIATSLISKGKSAAYSWQQTYTNQADQLAQLPNQLLAQRSQDLRDIGARVLRILTGTNPVIPSYPDNTILIAEDLTPSDVLMLDRTKIIGFCTVSGGATSHVSILARSMDIPAIAGIEAAILELPDSTSVILDGTKGILTINPTPEAIARVTQLTIQKSIKRQSDMVNAMLPAITQDGTEIKVLANISSASEAEQVMNSGGEGVGLLRTEFIFVNNETDRSFAPTEEEQTTVYSKIAINLASNLPLTIRTLDIGGDKPLPYIPIPHENNPFLGERGIRIGLDRPELLRDQLRAILRATSTRNLRVMFPMISRLEELRDAKAILAEEQTKLGILPIPIGIMIEIPSVAIMAEQFAQEVDFFSIGTNDLTQYTLAMDRTHPKLAPYVDGLNPAVLRLIDMTVKGAQKYNKPVAVCGSMANDPQAIPVLLGLGIQELSVSVPSIPGIKAQIRSLKLVECQQLAKTALSLGTASEVRLLLG